MKSKIFSIFFALVLVASLGLVMAVPAAAGSPTLVTPFTLEAAAGCTATWVTAEKHTGSSSVKLYNPAGDVDANYAEVAFALAPGTFLSSIDMSTTSFYCKTDSNWTPYFIFEFAGGERINTDATAGAGYTTWAQYVASSTPQWQWPDGSWHSWADTLDHYGSVVVTKVLVELSGLPAGSYTAYVDDIEINGTTFYGLIQDAVGAANPGDTIQVAAGTYNEDVTINKSLTLVSANGSASTIINGQATGEAGAVRITSGNVVFGGVGTGFTINGAGQAAVYFSQAVSGCSVEGNNVVAASGKNALLTVGGQSNHTIRGNTFSGTASQLVYVNGQASVHVASTNVDFIGNTFSGTATGPALGQEATDSEVSGNTFATVTGYADLELWGTGNTVTGNHFTADLPATGLYVLDNPGTLNIAEALNNNTFLRAVVVEHSSLLPKIWANIQAAIDTAQAGDTILVAAGTYRGTLIIHKANLTVKSTKGAESTIIDVDKGPDKSSVLLQVAKKDTYAANEAIKPGCTQFGFIVVAGGVTIDGFKVINAGTGIVDDNIGFGISLGTILSTYSWTVPWFYDQWGGLKPEATAGVFVGGCTIVNNVIEGANTGISLMGSSNNVIAGNTITGCIKTTAGNGNGITMWGGWGTQDPAPCLNNEIRDNTITDNDRCGIYIASLLGTVTPDWKVVPSGERVDFSGTAISGNTIGGSGRAGIGLLYAAGPITASYNNISGNTLGVDVSNSDTVDATRNWWGAATGPCATANPGVTSKMGNAVSDNVVFSPWLYKTQETIVPTREPAYAQSVVLDNFGAFAWNTFSAPIFLDGSADTWKELYDLTLLDYNMAYRFDLATQRFVGLAIDSDYAINPGEGFFIKMNTAGSLPILYSTGENLMPSSRPLTVDWNLIGLANMEDMEVSAALFSLAGDGQVVSPTGNIRPGAVPAGRAIYVGEGYWAYMLHERTLVGFTTTPVNWIP